MVGSWVWSKQKTIKNFQKFQFQLEAMRMISSWQVNFDLFLNWVLPGATGLSTINAMCRKWKKKKEKL